MSAARAGRFLRFAVPLMEMAGQRPTLIDYWTKNKGDDSIRDYWREKNATSFDGLPTGVLE